MNTLWIAKGKVGGEYIYLHHIAGATKSEAILNIMCRAANEGFYGTFKDRMEYLGWELVEIEFKETL